MVFQPFGFNDNWMITLRELEEGEDRVNYEAVAQAMRGEAPVPRAVRDYLARVFESDRVLRLKAGKPPKENWLARKTTHDIVIATYHMQHHLARLNKAKDDRTGTPHEIALENTVLDLKRNKIRMSGSNIKRILTAHRGPDYDKEEDPFWERPEPPKPR
jgi:hypothetical protein